MSRAEQIALAYATGLEPTYTTEEVIELLEDLASEEGVPQDLADKLRQGADRLKASMTPVEILNRMMAIKAKMPASSYLSASIYTFWCDPEKAVKIDASPNGDTKSEVSVRCSDWRAGFDELEAKLASTDFDAPLIEKMALALLSGIDLSNFAKAEVERCGEKARAKAAEMAARFTGAVEV